MRTHPIRYTIVLLLALGHLSALRAHEGMWLPTVLASVEDAMQAEGLSLSAEDIYSVNHGSLKDAVVLFGGGCTAEVISDQGLILTNHHCGFSAIQQHSSLEHDYLTDGFWAADLSAELLNQGLTATFVVRMEDVTDRILAALGASLTEAQRKEAIAKAGEAIVKAAIEGTHFNAVVRSFSYGNQFMLIVTETFRDVRLVGAPPGAVGKFGGDSDNWMWPRHTGDFSMFRIYCAANGAPADPSPDNVPFHPRHVLPVSLDGVKEGDFAMIFGFPGNTQRYLSSPAVQHILDVQDPLRIRMRQAGLGVIDPAMRASDKVRIQYADKQSSISNGYKKWIGEVRGLKEMDAVQRKLAFEAEYLHRADSAGRTDLAAVLPDLKTAYAEWAPLAVARDLFVELVYNGPEALEFADRFEDLALHGDRLEKEGKRTVELDRLRTSVAGFYKDYDPAVDEALFVALLPIYRSLVPKDLEPAALAVLDTKFKGDVARYARDLYSRSVFPDPAKLNALLAQPTARNMKKLAADPLFTLAQSFFAQYMGTVRPRLAVLNERIDAGMRDYVKGMWQLFPEKPYWPDANSTLRLSYGHVEGSVPRDGVRYTPFTTLDGALAKYVPGDAEFDMPERLRALHAAHDYGPYAENGRMPVCFTSSLHTTGGNSGSPVLNGRGELIGLNFDRTWESTMSDVMFDPAKCRNIAVDIRYVLFIIDKYAGAHRLVEEMHLVHAPAAPASAPIAR